MKVILNFDGREVGGLLQTSPNAIGICVVRVANVDYHRHVSHLRAVDDESAKVLAGGDRFVSRDPEKVIAAVVAQQHDRPCGWSIEDIEYLRVYVASAHQEALRKRSCKRAGQLAVVLGVTKQWLKQCRMNQSALEANLTEEQARDPICLLRAAKTALASAAKRYHEKTGELLPQEEKGLVSVISNYLNHYAGAEKL